MFSFHAQLLTSAGIRRRSGVGLLPTRTPAVSGERKTR